MSLALARRAALAFNIVQNYPNACIALGRGRLRPRFARFAGIDALASAIASPLHKDSIGVLGAAGLRRRQRGPHRATVFVETLRSAPMNRFLMIELPQWIAMGDTTALGLMFLGIVTVLLLMGRP